MAKIKAHSELEFTGALAKRTSIEMTQVESDLEFSQYKGDTDMKTKSVATTRCTERQRIQREIWCDCDLLFQQMTFGQKMKWDAFCRTVEKLGQLKQIMPERFTKAKLTEKDKIIAYYGGFMSQCCKWDLLKFFSEFLNADWMIIKLEREVEETKIEMQIIDKTIDILPLEIHEVTPQRGLAW